MKVGHKLGEIKPILAADGNVYNYQFTKLGANVFGWELKSELNPSVDTKKLKKNVFQLEDSTLTNYQMGMAAKLLAAGSHKVDAVEESTAAGKKVAEGKVLGIYSKKLNKFGRIDSGSLARLQTHDRKYIFNYEYNSAQGAWVFAAELNNSKALAAVREKAIYSSRRFAGSKAQIDYEMCLHSESAIDLTMKQ